MTKCAFCGTEELLPFRCRYCGQPFCSEHRLPESHNCPAAGMNVIPMKKISHGHFSAHRIRRSPFRTSRTEIIHLTVAVLIIFAVYALGYFQVGLNAVVLLGLLGAVVLAFVFHELAHKITAQRYGLWSEFRLDPIGAFLTIMTSFLPIRIIAPGSVTISGYGATVQSMGKISLAGSIMNMIQSILFIFLGQLFPQWYVIFGFAASKR